MTLRTTNLWAVSTTLASGASFDFSPVASGARWLIKDVSLFISSGGPNAELQHAVVNPGGTPIYPFWRTQLNNNVVQQITGRFIVVDEDYHVRLTNVGGLAVTFSSYASGALLAIN